MTARVLPMFPLGSVLLPFTAVQLHIFEPRYRALARHCVEGDGLLGVVLIERGSEVGGGDVRFDVATLGRIADAVELDDGRWAMVVVGQDRLRVIRWLADDPYPRAEVEPCVDPAAGLPETSRRPDLDRVLRRVLALWSELGGAVPDDVDLAGDDEVATWQALALAPVGPLDTQRVLATAGVGRRLQMVLELLEDEAAVLAQRLAAG